MDRIGANVSNTLRGPIRIATVAYPPYVNDCGVFTLQPTKDCPYPGVDHEILGHLLAFANISYEIFPHTGEVNWGDLQADGTYDGLMGDVINGMYDTIGSTFVFTEVRSAQLEFSYNIYYESATYVVSNVVNPDREWLKLATLIFRVFDVYSSVGLLGIILFLSTLILLYSSILDAGSSKRPIDKSIIKNNFKFHKQPIVLHSKDNRVHRKLSTRIAFLMLAYTALLMEHLYEGGLFTIIVTSQNSKKRLTEESLLKKLEDKEYRLIDDQEAYETDYFFENIRQRSEDYYERYRKILKINPVEIENDPLALQDKLLNRPGYVKHVMSPIEAFEIVPAFCEITWVPAENDGASWLGYIFRKGSIWRPIVSENTVLIGGFIGAAYNRYKNGTLSCTAIKQRPTESLALVSLFSVFLLPVFGGLIGFSLLLFEMIKYHRSKRRFKYILPHFADELDSNEFNCIKY